MIGSLKKEDPEIIGTVATTVDTNPRIVFLAAVDADQIEAPNGAWCRCWNVGIVEVDSVFDGPVI